MKYELACVVAGLLVLSGCSQQSSDAVSPPAEASASASSQGGGTPTAETSGGSSITGVAECDDYLAKVKACIAKKVPAAQQAQFEQALDQSQKSWAALGDKTQLAQACKAATQQAKATYAAMGCEL